MTDSTVRKLTNTLNDLQMYMYLWLIDWIGTFSNNDDHGSETSLKNELILRSFKLIIASIWTRSICQILATFSGVELLRILLKLKKRKENSSWYVHVLHKTSN